MSPTRLLIAEDDPGLIEVIVDVLSQRGFEIAGRAHNLSDALQLMINTRFDGAVLDVKLFGLEMSPLLEQLRAYDVPYVLISGTAPIDLDSPWLRSLPQVRKPFSAHELLEAIKQSLTPRVT